MEKISRLRSAAGRAALLAAVVAVLAGCGIGSNGTPAPAQSGSGGSNGTPTPAPSPTGTIQPAQQLTSAQQLQSDIKAVEAAADEQRLQQALRELQQDYMAVAGTAAQAAKSAADWQQALASLNQSIATASKAANASSGNPSAPNPITATGGSGSDIISQLNDAYDLLSKVIGDITYTIVVHNADNPGGVATAQVAGFGPFPAINCGVNQSNGTNGTACAGVVLALTTVRVDFVGSGIGVTPFYTIGMVTTDPGQSCSKTGYFPSGPAAGHYGQESCNVTAASGQTVTLTPMWEGPFS
jgi:hypothetical protein